VEAVQAKEINAVADEEDSRAHVRLFAPDLRVGADCSALTVDIAIGNWQTVEWRISAGALSGTLQIRPSDRPAVIEVREISIYSDLLSVIWTAKTAADLQALQTKGSLSPLPGNDRCLFFSFGADPLWLLLSLPAVDMPVSVKVVLRIHKDLEAVSQAVAAAHTDLYRMAAEVRSASADRNKTLREYNRRTQAALEDRDSALLKLKEQVKLTQFAKGREAELQEEKYALELQLKTLRADHEALRQRFLFWEKSRAWRMTRPLRSAAILAQKLKKKL